MKIKNKLLKINRKKIIISSIFLLASILCFIMVIFYKKDSIKFNKNKKQEEFQRFVCERKDFVLNDDYSYTFDCLITVQELNGIDYIKYNKDGEEITLNGNGKNKIAIDYKAHENTEYTFEIKPVNENKRNEKIKLERKVAGADTYKLVNGVYLNTPFLENFNQKYTRYLSLNENNVLAPRNWIYNEEPNNWYSYNEKNWANIYVECEGVGIYYVWIPRYVYKLDQENQRSDVKFVDVYNNYKNAETGEELSIEQLVEQGYKLPEAFNFGDSNATAISGYWMSKYQLSELEGFLLDFNMSASTDSIIVSNLKNNMGDNAKSFTYAINGEIKNTTTTLEDYTFTGLTEGETYVINVTALRENGELAGSMTKVIEPVEVNAPELDGFNKDTTFYVYWDENGKEHNEIPISKDPPQDWYNYAYSKWANIVTRNNGLETYYVWIPRYQYALNQTSQRSNVKFILGTGRNASAGYKIPDAFWFDKNDNGEEDEGEQLKGYWMTKYQLLVGEGNNKINTELAAASNCIHVRNITGTSLKTKDEQGNFIDASLRYEYYLNGNKVYEGTNPNECYTYSGLDLNTTYTVNIIARNENNDYVGAYTKQIKTKVANEPDLSSFRSNDGLKNRTYYCIYNGDQIQEYRSISQNEPSNWYDYSEARWANIVVTDGTINGNQIENATSTAYFVWIPRYQYSTELQMISNSNAENKRSDVIFLNDRDTTTDPGYKIPDAFWFDKNDDGIEQEDERLTGYWMTKYQLQQN